MMQLLHHCVAVFQNCIKFWCILAMRKSTASKMPTHFWCSEILTQNLLHHLCVCIFDAVKMIQKNSHFNYASFKFRIVRVHQINYGILEGKFKIYFFVILVHSDWSKDEYQNYQRWMERNYLTQSCLNCKIGRLKHIQSITLQIFAFLGDLQHLRKKLNFLQFLWIEVPLK